MGLGEDSLLGGAFGPRVRLGFGAIARCPGAWPWQMRCRIHDRLKADAVLSRGWLATALP